MLHKLSSKGIRGGRRHILSQQSPFGQTRNNTKLKEDITASKELKASAIYFILFILFYLIFRLKYFGWPQTMFVFVLAFLLFLAINYKNSCSTKSPRKIIGLVLGLIVFLSIYNMMISNPFYDDWLLDEPIGLSDAKVHYYGWLAYRNESIQFPLGKMIKLGYPQTSIVFADSIPLVAMFLKPIAKFIPGNFQYFGIWVLICYMLMGHFSFNLLRLYSQKIQFLIPASLLIISSPILTQSFLCGYFSLLAHFLLIWSFYLVLKKNEDNDIFQWALLLSISVLIQIYLFAMIMLIFLFYFVSIRAQANLAKKLMLLTLILSLQLLLMYVSGYFIGSLNSSSVSENTEFGLLSSNLNSFINPLRYSKIIKPLPLPLRISRPYVFNYLGLGLVLAFLIAIAISIKERYLAKLLKKNAFLIIPITLMTLFSFTNKISFNRKIIFQYNIPHFLMLLTQFASTSRFLWPLYYLIIIFTLYTFSRIKKSQIVSLILLSLIVFQLYELSMIYNEVSNFTSKTYKYENILASPLWSEISKINKELAIVNLSKNSAVFQEFMVIAVENNLTLSNVHLARTTREQAEHIEKRTQELIEGRLQKGIIYACDSQTYEHIEEKLIPLQYQQYLIADFNFIYLKP